MVPAEPDGDLGRWRSAEEEFEGRDRWLRDEEDVKAPRCMLGGLTRIGAEGSGGSFLEVGVEVGVDLGLLVGVLEEEEGLLLVGLLREFLDLDFDFDLGDDSGD